MKFYFLLFGFMLALLSCNPPDSPTIFANIYVRYEEPDQKIKAEMIFSEGETATSAKPISFQGGVAFLGSGTESRTLPGGILRYEVERKVALPESIPVHFTDKHGRDKDIVLQIPSIRDFELPAGPVKKSEGFTLKLDTPAFEGTDKLVLIITGADNQSLSIEVPGGDARQEMEFAPGKFASLAPGEAKVYLVRTGSISRKEGRYEIDIQTEFYSKIKSLLLTER